MRLRFTRPLIAAFTLSFAAACVSKAPEGIAPAKPAKTTVKYDLFHRPLPEIPLPNDLATRFDETSATKRRINASMVAPTQMESRVRSLIDQLDGWGTLQPIGIPFTGPLDPQSILDAHTDPNYGLADDVVYLINVDRASKDFGKLHHLDVGNGNYPVVLEKIDQYWKNDPRGETISLIYEEVNEDRNGNGKLDPGEDLNGNGILDPGEDLNDNGILDPPEDTDADGVLDVPNYLPGANPDPTVLAERADALMTFYEKQSNTLILRPMEPLDERTTYAVVVTRRLKDASGDPVGSPFKWVNHTAQTDALSPLSEVLPEGLKMDDVAFAFSYTTQTTQSAWQAMRDGLYGHGVQKHLGTEFPAEVTELLPLRDDTKFPGMKQPHLIYGEQWKTLLTKVLTSDLIGEKPDTESYKALVDGLDYIDYVVIGSFESPQLFDREDADGKWLPFDLQSWPPDVHSKAAKARRETVYFTLTVPRKEVSRRGENGQAPVLLQGHGYGSNRFEGLQMSSYFARHGFATLSIDGPSHGITMGDLERGIVSGMLSPDGFGAAAKALTTDRAHNQDNDPMNTVDSGADFWTAYLFHTRDVLRQYTLDWMQAVRVIRSFDGKRQWAHDTNGDGKPDLAGDFDGDGHVDIGADSTLSVVGGSLGGFISQLLGSLEPEITAIAPIAGGGGLSDIGIRTTQSGAYEGFILRSMGPLYVGTQQGDGSMLIETIIPNMARAGTLSLARIDDVREWDTLVVENLVNGERGCGYVQMGSYRGDTPSLRVRAAVASDEGDRTRILLYAGPQLVTGDIHCTVRDGVEPKKVIDTFEIAGSFQWDEDQAPKAWAEGDPLVSLADGLGLPRAHPDLRRFAGLGQLVLDSADPVTFARHLSREPLEYPGTGQKTGTHAIVVTTIGDMAVPANAGVTYGRAAGFIDYLNDDPRFGLPENQVLLDNFVAEAVHTLKRYTHGTTGGGVHLDVENFSDGDDLWGTNVPRISTPLRIGFNETDPLGGKSAALFPLPSPEGAHGFDMPGRMRDQARKEAGCGSVCDAGLPADNICSCDSRPFDLGYFMFNMISEYLISGGKTLNPDLCHSRNDCPGQKPAPEARSGAVIDAP